MTLEEQIKEIIAEQALMDAEDVSDEHNFEDLGLDSIAMVEIIYGLEEAFDVQIPFNANDPEDTDFDFSSVQAVIDGVKDLIAQKDNA